MRSSQGIVASSAPRASGGFAPTDIGGLAGWWDASNISGLSNADPVSTWPDTSGNGRSLTQSGTSRPTYRTAVLNGLPVVRFDGSDDSMDVAYSGLSGEDQPFTLYVVALKSGGDTVFSLARTTSIAPVHSLGGDASPAVVKSFRRSDSNIIAERKSASTWSGGSTFDLATMVFPGTTVEIRLNGTSVLSEVQNVPTATFDRAVVGSFRPVGASPAGFWNGDVAAVLLYEGAHGSSDIAAVEAYLTGRFGL